ncbi:T9SS type A sorting domain-containing protein [Aquiflexum sp.]|uniref:T9SS type A sorting domain-containing protein n=1 Tax=Aquiflexum sp. TaxID=1872584 RepID=UPI0035935C69
MKHFSLLLLIFILSWRVHAQSPAQGWSVMFPEDPFTDDALLDLRFLNEIEAGSTGFIGLSDDGESFVDGTGQEIRIWAIGGGDDTRNYSSEQLASFAKFLAKRGVNMIRTHARIHSTTNDINAVNTDEVNAIWRLVAAMKAEGIYTTISPFWVGHMGILPSAWELGDYVGDVKPWALMYFNDKFKNAYKNWVEYLFTEVNPHTGLALKDDPAVGLIQMKNEDGIFFWTIQGVQPSLMSEMQSQYHEWLLAKYGSIGQAYAAWQNLAPIDGDNPANGKMGLYIIWEATQTQTGGKDKRITDQIHFYSDVQRGFYQEVYDHLRTMGCQQLINTNNWKTADPLRLFDAERYTNDVADVIAVNRYYSPQHVGANSGWRIDPGHHYVGASVLHLPHRLPINVKHVKGKPFIISESAWNLPHKYQAEGPFLIASYSALNGFDAYYWFTPRSPGFDAEPYFTWTNLDGGQHPLSRWNVSTPGQVGMFPANALMYRMGYIQQAPVLVHEGRTLQSIYERKIPIIAEENSFDPNRDSYDNIGGGDATTKVAPIAYLAGRVSVEYDTGSDTERISSQLDELLDFQNRKITSATGQLTWDYEQGMCLLDAPSAQGICGFPGEKHSYELSSVKIETTNDYVVVNVVAMDNKTLSSSEHVLIQIGTKYQPTGWQERATTFNLNANTVVEGFEIQNTGTMPWKASNSLVNITLNNPNIKSARLLDINGYEVREIRVENLEDGQKVKFILPQEAMYIVADTREADVITSLPEIPERAFNIYPNPTDGSFNIQYEADHAQYSSIEIRELSGKLVKQFNQIKDSYSANLSPGVYMLIIIDNRGAYINRKLLIK